MRCLLRLLFASLVLLWLEGSPSVLGFTPFLRSYPDSHQRARASARKHVAGAVCASSNDVRVDDSDASFMESLQKRVEQVSRNNSILPLVVLDSMLPRQVLKISVKNGLLMELVKNRLEDEIPYFGMLGMARLQTGEQVHLKTGVRVEMVGKPHVTENGTLQLELRAGQRFRIQPETVENAGGGWTQAQVDFLDSSADDNAEWEIDSGDPMSMTRAMQMAKDFTDPKLSLDNSMSLVDMWIQLARQRERIPGQIDQLLQDLGPIPSWEEPTECAFWVGALINPIPAMGVAQEIRPNLLVASTAEARTQIALDGIWNSIQFMKNLRSEQVNE